MTVNVCTAVVKGSAMTIKKGVVVMKTTRLNMTAQN